MLKEAIEKIQELARSTSRKAIIPVADYGAYTDREVEALYDDKVGAYGLQRPVVESRTVSNIDSLIAAVVEEARRTNNATGDLMTVCFTQGGGWFRPDDDHARGLNYNYERKFSNQWKIVKSLIEGSYVDHFGLIQAIQALKPSLGDSYLEVMMHYSKLKLNSTSELTSQPIFSDEGDAGEGYVVNFSLSSGVETGDQYLPSKLNLELPYVKNSDNAYELELEISIVKTNADKFAATFLCPGFEQVEEQAIKDEIDKFRKEVAEGEAGKLTDLLITESF